MKNAVAPFFSKVAIQEQCWSPHLSQNALSTLDHHAEVVFRACESLLETLVRFGWGPAAGKEISIHTWEINTHVARQSWVQGTA